MGRDTVKSVLWRKSSGSWLARNHDRLSAWRWEAVVQIQTRDPKPRVEVEALEMDRGAAVPMSKNREDLLNDPPLKMSEQKDATGKEDVH